MGVPDHPVALALLSAFGGGVTAPSADRFGLVSPTTADHVRVGLGAAVDFYAQHYNGRRPHRGQQLRPPRADHAIADLTQERIKRRPVPGGLINEYERAA